MARKPRTAFPAGEGSPAPTDDTTERRPRRAPMFVKGAASLDKAQQSAAAETRMFRMLPVDVIDPSPIRDRIDIGEDLEALKRSLAEEGQQIPILVRPKPDSDRFEIVTGRRRLQATKEIGRDQIQAFVRRMSDEEAFIAQGVENNARLETSFIERARTILSALETGFTQVQVEKFLGVDQTMISRMKTIYSGLGEALVLAIGPARGIGRRKWERLQKLVGDSDQTPDALAADVPALPDSVERFDGFLALMERRAPKAPRPAPAKPAAGTKLAHGLTATRKGRALTLRGDKQTPDALLEFLEARLPALLKEYDKTRK